MHNLHENQQTTKHRISIDKFSGKQVDFKTWKQRLRYSSDEADFPFDLFENQPEFVDILQTDPTTSVQTIVKSKEDQLALFKRLQRSAHGTIMKALDPIAFQFCSDCETPLEIINKMTKFYHRTDNSTKIDYLTRLFSFKMTNPDPDVFFAEYQSLIAEQAHHGLTESTFSLSDLNSMLCLNAIDSRFATVVSIICNEPKVEGIESIQARIRDEYKRMNKDELVRNVEIHAAYPRRMNGNILDDPTRKYPEERKQCAKCGIKHHSQCPPRCDLCKELHYGRFCKTKCVKCGKFHFGVCNANGTQFVNMVERGMSGESENKDHDWYIDSGASVHLTHNFNLLTNFIENRIPFHTASGSLSISPGHGHSTIILDSGSIITLKQVLYFKEATKNLISVSQLAVSGYDVQFHHSHAAITKRHSTMIVAVFELQNGLYKMQNIKQNNIILSIDKVIQDAFIQHCRFGHPGNTITKLLVKNGQMQQKHTNFGFCADCALGKSTRQPFLQSESRSQAVGDLISADLKSYPTATFDNKLYYVIFIDDYSKYSTVKLMQRKSEAFHYFKEYCNMLQRQYKSQVKIFRSDNGGEFMSGEFIDYCKEKGIIKQTTVAHCPQQNGKAERTIRTLDERVMTIKSQSKAPDKLWGAMVVYSNYMRNRLPSTALNGQTPYEILHNKTPINSHLKVFGSDAFAHIPTATRKGLDSKAIQCKMIGYAVSQKSFILWDIKEQRILISRDVIFNESLPKLPFEFDTLLNVFKYYN